MLCVLASAALSGGPNIDECSAQVPSLRTWNGRGVFTGARPSDTLRMKKLSHLHACVQSADFCGIQETHVKHATLHDFFVHFDSRIG